VAGRIVSIIIPSYNSSNTLPRVLRSVLEQQGDHIREVIVVDSSDDDSIWQIEEQFISLGVQFINSGSRVIAAVQRNIGAAQATGSILLFLDSDVIPRPGYVDAIVRAHAAGCRAGFGGVVVPGFQRTNLLALAQYYTQLSEYIPRGPRRRKSLILGCNNFCERELFWESGGYPPIRASEDVVYGHNLGRHAPIWFVPDAAVAHIFRESLVGFLRYQKFLGQWAVRYRRQQTVNGFSNETMLGDRLGRMQALALSPAFFFSKIMRIVPRIASAGASHILRFIPVLPLFIVGMLLWTTGFVQEAGRFNEPKRGAHEHRSNL